MLFNEIIASVKPFSPVSLELIVSFDALSAP